MFSSEILRSPRSTAPIKVLCKPHSKAKSFCDQPFSIRKALTRAPNIFLILFSKAFKTSSKYSEEFMSTDYMYQLIIQGLIGNDRKLQLCILFILKDDVKKLTGDIWVGQQSINGISLGGISNSFDNTFVPHNARNGC